MQHSEACATGAAATRHAHLPCAAAGHFAVKNLSTTTSYLVEQVHGNSHLRRTRRHQFRRRAVSCLTRTPRCWAALTCTCRAQDPSLVRHRVFRGCRAAACHAHNLACWRSWPAADCFRPNPGRQAARASYRAAGTCLPRMIVASQGPEAVAPTCGNSRQKDQRAHTRLQAPSRFQSYRRSESSRAAAFRSRALLDRRPACMDHPHSH
jgi:hypothetical protein